MCPPHSVSQLSKQPMKRVRFDESVEKKVITSTMEETSSTSSSRNSSNKSISDTGSTLENDHSNDGNQRPCRPQYPTTARSCSSFYPLSSRVAPIKRPTKIPGMLFSLTPLGSDNNSYHRWSGQEEHSGNSKSTACAPSVPVRLPSMEHMPTSTISEILGSALAILGEEPYASISIDNNNNDDDSSLSARRNHSWHGSPPKKNEDAPPMVPRRKRSLACLVTEAKKRHSWPKNVR